MQEKDTKAPSRPPRSTAGGKPGAGRQRDGRAEAEGGRTTPVDQEAQRESGRERAADRGYD